MWPFAKPKELTLAEAANTLYYQMLIAETGSGIPKFDELWEKMGGFVRTMLDYYSIQDVAELPEQTVLAPKVAREYNRLQRWYYSTFPVFRR